MKSKLFADDDYRLWWQLILTRRAINKAREKELRPYGISATQAAVLFIIQANPGKTTPGIISSWLLLEPHTVSGILNRMQKLELIQKVKDLERKNLVRVVITDKGRQAYRHSTRIKSVRKIMGALSPQQRSRLLTFLQTLQAKALEELGTERKQPFP